MCHSDWHCTNFVMPKPHVKRKVLKHKKLVLRGKAKLYCCLFVCFFSSTTWEYFKCNKLKRLVLSAFDMTKFAQCRSETCFRMAHFSKRHTIPIWNKFQNGTFFQNGTECQCETCFRKHGLCFRKHGLCFRMHGLCFRMARNKRNKTVQRCIE